MLVACAPPPIAREEPSCACVAQSASCSCCSLCLWLRPVPEIVRRTARRRRVDRAALGDVRSVADRVPRVPTEPRSPEEDSRLGPARRSRRRACAVFVPLLDGHLQVAAVEHRRSGRQTSRRDTDCRRSRSTASQTHDLRLHDAGLRQLPGDSASAERLRADRAVTTLTGTFHRGLPRTRTGLMRDTSASSTTTRETGTTTTLAPAIASLPGVVAASLGRVTTVSSLQGGGSSGSIGIEALQSGSTLRVFRMAASTTGDSPGYGRPDRASPMSLQRSSPRRKNAQPRVGNRVRVRLQLGLGGAVSDAVHRSFTYDEPDSNAAVTGVLYARPERAAISDELDPSADDTGFAFSQAAATAVRGTRLPARQGTGRRSASTPASRREAPPA